MKINWFLMGDIHGEAGPIRYFYNKNKERLPLDDCENYIILLGDVGCNYEITGNRDAVFKKALSDMPFTYICLRGNHESRAENVASQFPDKWEKQAQYNGLVWVEKEYPNIHYLEDVPAVYEFAGYKTLSIPGAYSVDKWYRLRHKWKWFEDEQLSLAEMEFGRRLVNQEKTFDLIISHTCSIAYEPRDLFLPDVDQSAVDKSMEVYLGEIEALATYKRWAFGHFHEDRIYPWREDGQLLMLYDQVVDLEKFMKMKSTDYWNEILA